MNHHLIFVNRPVAGKSRRLMTSAEIFKKGHYTVLTKHEVHIHITNSQENQPFYTVTDKYYSDKHLLVPRLLRRRLGLGDLLDCVSTVQV